MHGDIFCRMDGTGLAGNYNYAFGFPRYVWIDIHSWLSILLAILILLHIIFHIRWIYEILKKIKSYLAKIKSLIIERCVVFIALFLLFTAEIISGLVLWIIMPVGVEDYHYMISGIGRTFWGLQRNIWVDIHAWFAVTIISIIIIHLIMHWKWIVRAIKENNTVQTIN